MTVDRSDVGEVWVIEVWGQGFEEGDFIVSGDGEPFFGGGLGCVGGIRKCVGYRLKRGLGNRDIPDLGKGSRMVDCVAG